MDEVRKDILGFTGLFITLTLFIFAINSIALNAIYDEVIEVKQLIKNKQ